MAKEYFSHDYDTRLDKRIKPLLIKHGYEGYGLFWGIVEDLYNNKNELPVDYEAMAFDYRVSPELIRSVINDFGLFKIKGEIFFSDSIKSRLKERKVKSEKARESVLKRWNKDTNVLRTYNERNTNKVKESKVNKSIVKDTVFVAPSLSEVEEYFVKNGYTKEAAKKAYDYYNEANWHDRNGSKVKNWKQKMISVWIKPENKKQDQLQTQMSFIKRI